jgi:hypothetical protein
METLFRRHEDNIIVALGGRRYNDAEIAKLINRRSVDWDYIAAASDSHNISHQIYSKALDLPLPGTTKKRIAEAAKTVIVHAIHDRKVQCAELSKILSLFSARGIRCILIKGLSIDRSMIRQSGDIDILVKPESLIDAIETVLELPEYRFRESMAGKNADEWRFSGSLSGKDKARIRRAMVFTHEFQLYNIELGVLVELHINLFLKNRRSFERVENIDGLLNNIGRIWEACQSEQDLGCMVPSPEHSLLIMCMHNALKRSPSNNRFRLGTIVDIDGLVTVGVDWMSFLDDCRRFGMVAFTYFSLRLARRLMKTPVPAFVLSYLKRGCTGLQLMAVRFHLRCVGSLQTGSFLYRGLYQSIGPFAFGGSSIAKLTGALFMPLWMPPLRKLSIVRNSRGNSLYSLFLILINPILLVIKAMALYSQ